MAASRLRGTSYLPSLSPNSVRNPSTRFPRHLYSTRLYSAEVTGKLDVEQQLSKPTWSVDSLLPVRGAPTPSISSKQLHHLLRLCALPPPKDADEEAKMLTTLGSQLHFVREIQQVDTTGVRPLQSLRDETHAGMLESEIGLAELRYALDQEEVRGKYNERIRRKQETVDERNNAEEWGVLGSAEKTVGRYFVVEGGKEG